MKNIILLLLLPLSILTSCKKDLCQGVVCQNGGTCLNGLCSCPTGYEGPACEKEKTPKNISITGVRLLSFPTTKPNGAGWDILPSSGPDLFFTLTDVTTKKIISPYPGFYASNATNTILPLNMPVNTPIKITDVKNRYEINLYDWDQVGSDELIGGVNFDIYVEGGKFPTKISLNCPICNTSWELSVTYEF